jgi:hypothetical protein
MAVLEFLRTSRELIASQREVVLGYLGREAAANGHFPSRSATNGSSAKRNAPIVHPKGEQKQLSAPVTESPALIHRRAHGSALHPTRGYKYYPAHWPA